MAESREPPTSGPVTHRRSQQVLGASPRQRGRARVWQLGLIQSHHAGKRFFGWLIPGVFSSTLSSQIGPFPCCYRSAGMARAGSGRARPSRAARGQGPSVGDGHSERPGCAGSSVRPPAPPHPAPQEQRRGLTWPPAKMTGELDGLGRYGMVTPFGGDWVTGREGRSDTKRCWHRAPSPHPTPPGLCSACPAGALGDPRQCYFFPISGTGPREDTQEHGRAMGDTVSSSQGPA